MDARLVAPCGLNCGLCRAFLREKNPCLGCRAVSKSNPIARYHCRIKNCKNIKVHGWKFCRPTCDEFPCHYIHLLQKRYSAKYGVDVFDNLRKIRESGLTKFAAGEDRRYLKGGLVWCMHTKRYRKRKP